MLRNKSSKQKSRSLSAGFFALVIANDRRECGDPVFNFSRDCFVAEFIQPLDGLLAMTADYSAAGVSSGITGSASGVAIGSTTGASTGISGVSTGTSGIVGSTGVTGFISSVMIFKLKN
jgi:hypothetical protein